jgi:hypothetical protein
MREVHAIACLDALVGIDRLKLLESLVVRPGQLYPVKAGSNIQRAAGPGRTSASLTAAHSGLAG